MKRAPAQTVKLGLIQTACSADPVANLKKTLALAERAARRGAQIICTQELFRSQYFCQKEDHGNFKLAEPIPGPTTDAFCQLAKKHRVVVIASLFERRAAGVYHNTAAIIDADGSLLGIYRKMHIPDDPLYYEKFYFTPGDLGFKAWQTRYGKIGVLICWDQWYPEAARLTALQGAQILFYPTAIGWHPGEKRNTANASTIRGKPSSAAMPSPTAVTLPWPIASGTKSSRAGASNSGARVSWPEPPAKSSPKLERPKRKF